VSAQPSSPSPASIRANPIRTRKDWEAAREAASSDPGAFHGEIARRELYWLDARGGAWVKRVDGPAPWLGFDAETGARRSDVALPADWVPWQRAFDDTEAPFYRWFAGGLTNACFNEVDVHVLAGRGREVAFTFEGDRWDPAADGGRGGPVVGKTITRQELMWQVAKHAVVLADLGLAKGDRIALNMPNVMEQIYFTEAAKRLGIIYTPVFGGFSAKTLSDRIHDAGAKIVITTDGAYRNAQVVGFKEPYTDRALDDYVPLGAALAVVGRALRALAHTDAKIGEPDVAAIEAGVASALTGEITVERADVMRGVGQALEARAGWDAATKARVRTAIAEALARPVARVERVVVVRNTASADLAWVAGRDVWAHELGDAATRKLLASARAAGVAVTSEAEALALDAASFTNAVWATTRPLPVDAEFPLFIIYTSGSTGKPKGVVHTHGGYVAGLAHTMRVSFDVPYVDRSQDRSGDGPDASSAPANDHVIYVVADPGWITGQSYLISAALTTGTTSVVAEGSPLFPHAGRFASIIERYRVTLFKAGSTFLKAVASDPQNVEDVKLYDRASLRAATFCAEPVSPSIQKLGMELLTPQYINSYWATEHGGIVLTHFYGNDDFALRPDAHTFPLPWVFADVWIPEATFEVQTGTGARTRHEHRRAALEEKGELVITRPYPYLARTVWGDGARVGDPAWRGDLRRFTEIYFDRWSEAGSEGRKITWAYTQGDYACRYEDGGMTLHGRSDDVINTSGHRLGTEEIEGAILKDKQNPKSPVGNAIVVGAPHKEKGTVPLAFILTAGGRPLSLDDERRLTALVREEKGVVAAPAGYICVSQFPETRSGKYMRRFLKNLLEGEPLGDTTTLRNPESLDEIARAIRRWQARAALEDEQELLTLYATLRLEVHAVKPGAAIAVLTISKPPVNALDERTLDELNTVVEHLARRENIKAIVLTGAGTQSGANVFVAGADVRQLLEEMHAPEDVLPLCHKAAQVTRKLEGMGKPVIAAVNGVALGGGNEFQMAAHYRIAEVTATFGQPEINLHLLPGYGGTQRLPRLLEDKRGFDGLLAAVGLILGGRSVGAEEAAVLGLVDEVAIEGDALSRATALARRFILGGGGPLAEAHAARLRANARWAAPAKWPARELEAHPEMKRLVAQAESSGRALPVAWALEAIRHGYERGLPEGLEREGRLFAEAVVHPEAGKRGLRAFFDRRSAPLPTRRRPELDAVRADEEAALADGRLLPVGAPFYPGVTPLPAFQYALLAEKDAATGVARHGDPATAERKRIIPVPSPRANEALLYMLTSEINFNDIWAITGVPVSPFDSHDEDWHVTGSGGLALVARVGDEVKREGRIKVGDLVAVFSGQSQLLSPVAGLDPMFADQHIQGYETPDGSHQQFMIAQAPQLFPKPGDLTLEAAGSYILNLGTVTRALFTTLGIEPGKTLFVEGAATGTGAEVVKAASRNRVRVTGLVSSRARGLEALSHGARGAIDRKDPRIADIFTPVPEDPAAWAAWEQAGLPFVGELRRQNDGRLADYVVSHAGETSFPRGFQLLEGGGTLTFFGASSGYRFTFMGKPGGVAPEVVLGRAGLTAGESVLVFYGLSDGSRTEGAGALDAVGLECIEAAREQGARIVVCAKTDAERDFVKSMGFGEAVRGVFSVQELQRRESEAFAWPRTMPLLPDPRRETVAFKEAVRWYQEQVFKPFASQVGAFLRGAGNPRGYPDLVVERAGQDTLALSSMLVKPFTGRVVFCEDMAGRRYTFYAPQVWMRQRRIYLPTANIWGTHLSNAYEVQRMNELVDAGLLQVGDPLVVPFDEGPGAHQEMWENRHRASNYVLNHALPEMGLKTKDELYQAWAKLEWTPRGR
jgi:acrylyl-CoA reductase (NADPH)/3-hydroxypropionyl-CoA dehydratase/3-hydroxypropionyl-CoA synthetase